MNINKNDTIKNKEGGNYGARNEQYGNAKE